MGELEIFSSGDQKEEYRAANIPSIVHLKMMDGCWKPPPNPRFKVNVDGVVFATQKEASFGVFIWNAQGLVILALSKKRKAQLGLLRFVRDIFLCNWHIL